VPRAPRDECRGAASSPEIDKELDHMFTIRRLAVLTSALALLAATSARRAQAQEEQTMGPSRISIEGYLTEYSFDVPNGDRNSMGGVGVRAMLGRGDVTKSMKGLFNRARAGVFLTYTGEQDNVKTWHVGGQADIPLFAAPVVNGYVDPFVSLGLGGFHTSLDVPASTEIPNGFSATSTDFALSPGIGSLFPLFGAIALRGDIRDVIIFGDNTTNNWEFSGGLSVGF
jgi:Outer membrane protein beta-barrel domain